LAFELLKTALTTLVLDRAFVKFSLGETRICGLWPSQAAPLPGNVITILIGILDRSRQTTASHVATSK
jgi:hypothetical protein